MISLNAWKMGLVLPQLNVPQFVDSSWEPLTVWRRGLVGGGAEGEARGDGRAGGTENRSWDVKRNLKENV